MNVQQHDIDIVIPVYNEQKNIVPLFDLLRVTLSSIFKKITFIIVDDGSTDNPEEEVKKVKMDFNILVKYIRLSKNHGKDLALKCGLDHSTADICCFIDGDFQHPPEKIIEAYEKIKKGYNIVHVMKNEYKNETLYRKYFSIFFIKIINFLSDYKIYLTDFKVLDRKAVELVKQIKEINYYSNGIIDMVGLKSTVLLYNPLKRKFGKTKFNLAKLIKLSLFSIMSVSAKPLRVSIYLGLFISIMSFCYGLYVVFEKLILGQPIAGFATLAASMFFLGGVQLIFLGIIGLYIGKMFIESKHRPQYMIDYILDF